MLLETKSLLYIFRPQLQFKLINIGHIRKSQTFQLNTTIFMMNLACNAFTKNLNGRLNKLSALYQGRFYFSLGSQENRSYEKHASLRKEPWFQNYMFATNLVAQRNFTEALKQYYKVITTMEQHNQKGQAYYYMIFDKILKLNVLMDRPLETEQNLYKVIKTRKALSKNPILVYQNYQNLMIHQLNHNVHKGIKLGKALLSESQINSLPLANEKYIRLLLGNGYLLTENFPDAKKKYSQVLQMKPNTQLKGKALNNLAIACWWHKNPIHPPTSSSFLQQISYQQTRINRDYKQTKELLMTSIGSLENIQDLQEQYAIALEDLLNQKAQSLLAGGSKSEFSKDVIYMFRNKDSLKTIYNLIQYYIYNDPLQKSLISAWMRILLRAAAQLGQRQIIDQIAVKYDILYGQKKDQLVQNIQNLLQQYQKPPNLKTEDNIQRKIMLYEFMKIALFLKKQSESSEKMSINKVTQDKINHFQKDLLARDPYAFKRKYIFSQELSFMKGELGVL